MYFNPRSHERSDIYTSNKDKEQLISIHAPTRGATSKIIDLSKIIDISIHAPTRGATESIPIAKELAEFQSTLPREERRGWAGTIEEMISISIHAPTRGATVMTKIMTGLI